MRLVTHDADVERLLVEQNADVRGLGRLAPFERLALRQRPYGRRFLPVGLIKLSIDVNRSGRPLRPGGRRVSANSVWLLGGGQRATETPDGGEDRRNAHAMDVEGHVRGQRAS